MKTIKAPVRENFTHDGWPQGWMDADGQRLTTQDIAEAFNNAIQFAGQQPSVDLRTVLAYEAGQRAEREQIAKAFLEILDNADDHLWRTTAMKARSYANKLLTGEAK